MSNNPSAVAATKMNMKARTFFGGLVLILCLLFISHRHTAYMALDLILLLGLYQLLFNFSRARIQLRYAYQTIVLIPLVYVAGHMVSVVWYGIYLEFPATSLYIYMLLPLVVLAFDRFALKAHWLWYGVSLAGIAAGVFAVVEVVVQDIERAGGSFSKPIIFGDLSLILGLLSLMASRYLYQRHHFLLLLSGLGFVGGLLASLLSQSRGGWVFVPLALMIVGWCYRDVWRRSVVLRRGAVVGVIILALGIVSFSHILMKRFEIAETQIQTYLVDGPQDTSIGLRFELWRAALDIIAEHPVVGAGMHEFNHNVRELAGSGEIIKGTRGYRHAHNQFLHAWSTAGIFGLAGLLLAFWLPLRFFGRECRNDCLDTRALAVSGMLLVSGFFVFCLTDSLFVVSHAVKFYFFFILLLGYLLIQRQSGVAVAGMTRDRGRTGC